MKIAVTGASGYVGGLLAAGLTAQGHDVVHWSRRQTYHSWHHFDLSGDPDALPWQGLDGIVHAAYDFNIRSWSESLARNVNPSIHLLEAAKKSGVNHIVFISSISSFTGTKSIYGRSKFMVEEKTLELGGAVVRPGLVWGETSGGVMGSLECLVRKFPLVPVLWRKDGLSQFLVNENDLAAAVGDIFRTSAEFPTGIHEATHPDPVPLKSILAALAERVGGKRLFVPIPWQCAMSALKVGEFLGLPLPFRSDSLVGLLHRTPALLEKNKTLLASRFRGFV